MRTIAKPKNWTLATVGSIGLASWKQELADAWPWKVAPRNRRGKLCGSAYAAANFKEVVRSHALLKGRTIDSSEGVFPQDIQNAWRRAFNPTPVKITAAGRTVNHPNDAARQVAGSGEGDHFKEFLITISGHSDVVPLMPENIQFSLQRETNSPCTEVKTQMSTVEIPPRSQLALQSIWTSCGMK